MSVKNQGNPDSEKIRNEKLYPLLERLSRFA
jgi:hypothetical protein